MHQLPHVMNMQLPLQLYTCIAPSAGKIYQLQPLGPQLLFTEHSSSCATAAFAHNAAGLNSHCLQ
jgi:hypothetical protein